MGGTTALPGDGVQQSYIGGSLVLVPSSGGLEYVFQCQALLAMTGALWSTATDMMEAHTNLLPFDLMVYKICHRAAR